MGDSNKEEARTVFYASRTLLSSVGVLHEFLFLFPPGWNQAVFKLFTVQIFFSSPFEGQTASYRYGPSHCVSSFSPLVLGTNPNLVPICTDYSILEILLLHFGNALHLEKGPFRFSFFFFFFLHIETTHPCVRYQKIYTNVTGIAVPGRGGNEISRNTE